MPLTLAGCMVVANDIAATAPPKPEDRYVGKTLWVNPKFPVYLCDQVIDYRKGLPSCGMLPAGSEITINEAVIEQTAYSGPILNAYRATTAAGKTGFLKTTDPIMMLDHAARQKDLAEKADCDRRGGVSVGMSKAQVYASCWGRPKTVNETVTSGGRHEQWVYGGGYVYVDNGVVTSIQVSH